MHIPSPQFLPLWSFPLLNDLIGSGVQLKKQLESPTAILSDLRPYPHFRRAPPHRRPPFTPSPPSPFHLPSHLTKVNGERRPPWAIFSDERLEQLALDFFLSSQDSTFIMHAFYPPVARLSSTLSCRWRKGRAPIKLPSLRYTHGHLSKGHRQVAYSHHGIKYANFQPVESRGRQKWLSLQGICRFGMFSLRVTVVRGCRCEKKEDEGRECVRRRRDVRVFLKWSSLD